VKIIFQKNIFQTILNYEERINSIIRIFFLTAVLLTASLSLPLSAENSSDRENEFSQNIESGIESLFNLDESKTNKNFSKAIELKPDRPEGYFYTSMIYWNNIYFGNDMSALTSFEKWIDKTIEVAKESSGTEIDDKRKASSFLYLGGAYGYKGVISVLKHEWFSGFLNAWKGRKYLKKAY